MTRRWAAAVLVAAALLALFSGPGPPFVPFTGKLSLDSPFLKERYSAPFSDDFAVMERIGGAISASGRDDDAIRLRDAWRRVVFKRVLQEPHARPATVEDAIRSESREVETIREMAERALQRVSVRWLPDDNDTLSVWTLKRVQVTNGLPLALTRVAVATNGAEKSVAFSCMPATPTPAEAAQLAGIRAKLRQAEAKPRSQTQIPPPEEQEVNELHSALRKAVYGQDGVPLPAGESAAFICPDSPSSSETGAPRDAGTPLPLSYVQARPYFLSLGGAGVIGGSKHAYYGVADFELSGCAARGTCDETRIRQLLELQARWPQIAFVLAMLSLAGVTWFALRPLRGHPAPQSSWAATSATGFALVTSVLQLLVVYFLFNPRVGLALVFLFPLLLAGAALHAVATVSLAVVLAWKRAQVTRLRVFAMVLAILALAAICLLLFGCRFSPYTFGLSCG
jgi:hypothetical protein